jgi:hypothetical protein
MVKGINSHQEVLSARKIDEAFAKALQADVDKCIELNKEQEALKARLKSKPKNLTVPLPLCRNALPKPAKLSNLIYHRHFGVNLVSKTNDNRIYKRRSAIFAD